MGDAGKHKPPLAKRRRPRSRPVGPAPRRAGRGHGAVSGGRTEAGADAAHPGPGGYELSRVEVPHAPFDEVFHPLVAGEESDTSASAFVSGLAELQARRTQSGAGLMSFLEQNLDQFEEAVAAEIRSLAEEVTGYGEG